MSFISCWEYFQTVENRGQKRDDYSEADHPEDRPPWRPTTCWPRPSTNIQANNNPDQHKLSKLSEWPTTLQPTIYQLLFQKMNGYVIYERVNSYVIKEWGNSYVIYERVSSYVIKEWGNGYVINVWGGQLRNERVGCEVTEEMRRRGKRFLDSGDK